MAGTEWEPGFALAAYSFALKRWQGKKGTPLYIPRELPPALWQSLKRQWPRLEREPVNRRPGAQTLSLENRWMYPADSARHRFIGFTIATVKGSDAAAESYKTEILEARRLGSAWRFRALSTAPLPPAAELVLYKQWAVRGQLFLLPEGAAHLAAPLRAQGINARLHTLQDTKAGGPGFLYLAVLQTWWIDSKTVYARVDRMTHPPGNDVSYEAYGSVRLSHRAGRWTLTELGDWQGE